MRCPHDEKCESRVACLRKQIGETRTRMSEIAEELSSDDLADERAEELEAEYSELEVTLENPEDERKGLLASYEQEKRRADLEARAATAATEEGYDQPPQVRVKKDPFDTAGVAPYGPQRNREMRGRALEAIEASTRFVDDKHKQRATEIVERYGNEDYLAEFVLTGASEDYADGFLRALTGATAGLAPDFTKEESEALRQRHTLARAMGLSDVTGVLVPSHLDTMLILANDGRTNPFRQVCRQETGTTNVYQSVRTSGVTHSWTSEAGEVGDDAPSFSNPTATAYKGTVFVPISFEAFEDARGRESDILGAIEDAIDDAEASAFVSGNGTSQPRGLVTALDANTNAELDTTTDNAFGLVDVYALYEDLPPRYRNDRTTWFANLVFIDDIRQFGTDQYNTQTVQLGARTVPAVLGHPILEASYMDSQVAADGDNILVVGDPQTYLIYDRLGTSVEFIPNLFATGNNRPSGQRGWLAHHRTGANLTVGHASGDSVVGFRLLQNQT